MRSAHLRRPVLAEQSACPKLAGVPTEPADAASQHRDQPIDRDHEDTLLNPLDATRTNQTDHRHRAAPTPTPAPSRQPRRLVAHPSEMAIVVRPRFGLDRERDTGWCDRQRVDVPSPSPRQRMPQTPTLGLKDCKRPPDLVLGASAYPAAPGEREPLSGVEPERNRRQQGHRPLGRRRPQGPAPRERRRWRLPPPCRRATGGGTAGGARSSFPALTHAMSCRLPDHLRPWFHRVKTFRPRPLLSVQPFSVATRVVLVSEPGGALPRQTRRFRIGSGNPRGMCLICGQTFPPRRSRQRRQYG